MTRVKLAERREIGRSVIAQVAEVHHLAPWELQGKGGKGTTEITFARVEVARQLRDRGWSLKAIGDSMNLHHTSILHYIDNPNQTLPVIVLHPPDTSASLIAFGIDA